MFKFAKKVSADLENVEVPAELTEAQLTEVTGGGLVTGLLNTVVGTATGLTGTGTTGSAGTTAAAPAGNTSITVGANVDLTGLTNSLV